jgi:hypothetical protein
MADAGLIAYRIRSPLPNAPLGFGVTAWSLEDALGIIRGLDYGRFMPDDLAGVQVGVAHGHMTVDVRRVLADRPDYLLSGHSHSPSDVQDGAVRRITPGALHRAEEFTVALLDLASGELKRLSVPG